eukprot:5992004-Prymnesium_polylepis.1
MRRLHTDSKGRRRRQTTQLAAPNRALPTVRPHLVERCPSRPVLRSPPHAGACDVMTARGQHVSRSSRARRPPLHAREVPRPPSGRGGGDTAIRIASHHLSHRVQCTKPEENVTVKTGRRSHAPGSPSVYHTPVSYTHLTLPTICSV